MNKKLILLTPFLILLIAGCSTSSGPSKVIDVRVGFDGLVPELLDNTPPQKVFEGDYFPVIIKVKNNGAYSITDHNAIISLGVEKDYTKSVNLLQEGRVQPVPDTISSASFSLEGKSTINPRGEEEIISYDLQAGQIDPQSEIHTSTVIATLCYPYETILSDTVCIDTDVNNLRPGDKVCNNQDLVFGRGQGAPVAITKIETQMLPTQQSAQDGISNKVKPQFLIFVENKGPGLVIKNEVVNDFCTKSGTSHQNFNIVHVNAFLSDKELDCKLDVKPSSDELGHIKLKDRKDIIRCFTFDGDNINRDQDSYLSTLKIVLSYGYTQSISSSYFIQKPVS